MEYDFRDLPEKDRYRLLCSFVAPRPIALVTTVSAQGLSNAAPMSFFNVFSQDPPIVILGIQARPDGGPKDTMVNIRETGEFVVNLCDLSIAQQMVDCGIAFPSGIDEVEIAGLEWLNRHARWSAACIKRSNSHAAQSCSERSCK
jgi:flavin reductase (DIM6/NTAB) family NADH-FMN oxidoreductase RutF